MCLREALELGSHRSSNGRRGAEHGHGASAVAIVRLEIDAAWWC